jgi:glycosyltransferase involved in cell wall biosynthesis
MSDLVSVVIPVFNGSEFLSQAIESALGQTYTPLELIVIDDGSTDDTANIAQSYGDRLAYHHQENLGVAAALNRGIREAQGKYIAWLSHDDVFLPHKLERQVAYLGEHPEFRAIYSDFYIIDAAGEIIKEIETPWYPRDIAIWKLFGSMYINGSSTLIERTCFDDVGLFNEQLRYSQDMDMWMRMELVFDIGRIPEKLVKWRSHPDQGSREVGEHSAEKWQTYRRIFAELLSKGLIPEPPNMASSGAIHANAYTWLGDEMVTHREWYGFAVEQYAKSVSLWPSFRNPAGRKLIVNWIRDVYWKTRRGIGRLVRSILRAG